MPPAAVRADDPRLDRLEFDIRGVRIHAVAAGPADGPLVVLLHGFPEFWYCWRHQVLPLAEAGYRVVAWWTALKHPARVRRLVVLDAPHPVAARKYARRHWRQILRSWYIGFFQVSRLPERLLSIRGFATMQRLMTRSAAPGVFSADDLSAYRQAWSQPGALTAMVNWYRALRNFRAGGTDLRVRQKTLILWGDRDRFLAFGLAEASARFCDDARVVRVERASHWLQHERPRLVTAELLTFLAEDGGAVDRNAE